MSQRNTRRLDRCKLVAPRGNSETFTRNGLRLSVLTAEDAGVDGSQPWIASCDTHGRMLGCDTKAMAKLSLTAVNRVDWCEGCRVLAEHTTTGDE